MTTTIDASEALRVSRTITSQTTRVREREQRKDDQQHPGAGCHATAALEVTRHGEGVPDDRCDPEHVGTDVAVGDDQADTCGDRALRRVEREDEHTRPPAEEPERVRSTRVPGTRSVDVDAPSACDDLRAREGSEQICKGHEQSDDDGITHWDTFFATAACPRTPPGSERECHNPR